MLTKEFSAVVRAVATVVREYVAQATESLDGRVKELEVRAPVPGPQGDKGERGTDGVQGVQGPQGDRGEPGRDADASVVEALKAQIDALTLEIAQLKSQDALVSESVSAVSKALSELARPESEPPVISADVFLPAIAEEVRKAVDAIPVPADGKDGKDGVSLVGAFIDRDDHLILTASDGSSKDCGVVVGKDGTPGADADMPALQSELQSLVTKTLDAWPRPKDGVPGRDGTLENLKATYDGERTVTFTFKDGTPIEGGVIKFPMVLYRGLYDSTKTYETGDTVTWGGSQWIAKQTTTSIAPDENSIAGKKTWALSVMRGRQGKQGQKGESGDRGPQGPQGPQGPKGY